jgi:hypothetical protein
LRTRRPLPPQRRLWLRRRSRPPRRRPRKWSSRIRPHLQPRRPLPLRPLQRRLSARRRSQRLRRRPLKWGSRTRPHLQPRPSLPLRLLQRHLRPRRRSRAQSRQHPCRTNRRSHRSRRSIQRGNRLRRSHGKSPLKARKPRQNQFLLSDDRLSRRRKKRRARPVPRKTPATRLPQRRLRRQAFSSGWLMGSRTPSAT